MTTTTTAPALERRLGSGLFRTREVTFVTGEGAILHDDDGRRYVDCASAYGVASLGHAPPAVSEAIERQSRRLLACTPSFGNDVRAAYLEELVAALPDGLERVFLCNSGTEAVEAALKFARLSTGRHGVIACKRGFHGRTLGALSATWDPKYRDAFGPLVPGFQHVTYDDLDALAGAVGDDTACVILEVVQGEGGVRPASAEYLRAAAELCRERGALLVVDEVQTGFGRTGKLFAVEHAPISPDVLCLAKGIASGFPMGAVAFGQRVAELRPGVHGSTFGGNPLACAAARATLRTLRHERIPDRVATAGEWFQERLRSIESPRIREVRGLGLMIGVDLRENAGPVLSALLEKGIVALGAGPTVVRFLPPLVIRREELEEAAIALEECLDA